MSPELAVPVALAEAAPVSPPVAEASTAPVSPDVTSRPLPPVLCSPQQEQELEPPMPAAEPELAPLATATASVSPLSAFASGSDVASPDEPVLPPMATGAAVESPEVAEPEA